MFAAGLRQIEPSVLETFLGVAGCCRVRPSQTLQPMGVEPWSQSNTMISPWPSTSLASRAPMEHNAYVSLDTGKVYWTSDSDDAFDEDIPDDVESSDRYLAIPHKNELNLGRSLALRFVAHELPECYDEPEAFF